MLTVLSVLIRDSRNLQTFFLSAIVKDPHHPSTGIKVYRGINAMVTTG